MCSDYKIVKLTLLTYFLSGLGLGLALRTAGLYFVNADLELIPFNRKYNVLWTFWTFLYVLVLN